MDNRTIELVDEILFPYASNGAVAGYRNHVLRVISFCDELAELDEEQKQKITIAACFHDLGIYTDGTFDYLPPSVSLAQNYLKMNGLGEWETSIASMIDQHHCLRAIEGDDLAEIFRKGDLIDFSLGLLKKGVSGSKIAEVRNEFPNNGFHKNLARVACGWIVRHPLRPVPVVKW